MVPTLETNMDGIQFALTANCPGARPGGGNQGLGEEAETQPPCQRVLGTSREVWVASQMLEAQWPPKRETRKPRVTGLSPVVGKGVATEKALSSNGPGKH